MNRISFLALFIFSISSFSVAQKKDVTLDDIWKSPVFYPKSVSGFVNLKDGKSYCKLERTKDGVEVNAYDYQTGKKIETIISSQKIKEVNGFEKFSFGSFQFSSDEQMALIPLNIEKIYRRSSKAKYLVWYRSTNKVEFVDDEKIMYATFSPKGTHIAFVKDNNLYVKNLEKGKIKRLTKDGKKNEIINGAVDWVYEEEFSMSKGFFWNADGTALAYYRFDESQVKTWNMKVYGELYPELSRFKYPKAGEANSTVDVYICNLKGKRKKLDLGSERDQYIPRIRWTKKPGLCMVERLNRLQNKWELLLIDAKSGDVQTSLEEQDAAYVDIHDDLVFLDDGKHMITKSERTGYWHMYMHKVEGPQVFELTKGNFDVDHILGVDEKNQKVYFTSTEHSSIERHVYVVDFDGKNRKRLSQASGWHSAKFSKDFSQVFHQYSNAKGESKYFIRNADWEVQRVLEDNEKFTSTLSEYNLSPIEFSTLKVNGAELNYYMIKPQNMEKGKKYPMLMHVYGGPGSQTVKNQFLYSNYFWHQMLANVHGIIVVSVDNRGTGGKGAEFKKCTYQQLGKLEIEDQIAAAQKLGAESYIDENRIGIWGWSYGGYMSSLGITKGNDIFKLAIAVAPVTNWRYYDNIYTERYMRRPQDNPDGYDNNSPINHLDKLKGKYLIIHGTADDNVHFENSVMMVDKMISMNVPFDSEFYPNKNHGIYGGLTRLHLYTKMTDYLVGNL
jgi:dipeptidyl-peptidase-4